MARRRSSTTRRRSSARARRMRIEARRREALRFLVAGVGALALAAFSSLTGALSGVIQAILIVLGIGLLAGSVMLSRRYD